MKQKLMAFFLVIMLWFQTMTSLEVSGAEKKEEKVGVNCGFLSKFTC